MKKTFVLSALAALFVIAGTAWLLSDPTGETAGQFGAIDDEQAALERTRERTLRESRSGVEVAPVEAAPVIDFRRRPAPPLPSEPPDDSASSNQSLADGYSPGAYLGSMQRAQLTDARDFQPSPNPDWLGSAVAHDAILDQAARSGRAFTFAVLRVLPGTDLQALDSSLAALGSRIEGSTGAYVRIRLPAERGRLEAIAGLAGVLGAGAVPTRLKANEAFVQEMQSRSASDTVPVYISLMASDSLGEWRRALSEFGVVVGAYDSDLRSYTANLPAAALTPVLDADFVLSVEPVPVVVANHASAVPVMGVDGFRRYDPGIQRFSGLTGSGIAVGVLDTGLNTSHVDIAHGRASICGANFVTGENWDLWMDMSGHGTHVFGTIAGAGRADPLLAGMAPNLSHLRFGKVLSAEGFGSTEDIRRGMDYLSRPAGCSWQGTPSVAVKPLIVNMSLSAASLAFSGRGVGERKLDSVVRAHSQLYVVAQANSGQHGFSNFGTAKNSLAVGAVNDAGIIAGFSSHGPTADGRLAPNVVGTGVSLTSARGYASLSGHDNNSGTSMAAPSVAGVAALLMEQQPAFRNRPALSRARLMASAVRPNAYLESRTQLPGDNTDGPGAFLNLYGLGLVSARTTLFSRDDPEGWLIGIASSRPDDDTYEYFDIEVPEDAGRLDVVLTWDEQPADTLTRSVLNNLDLWADHGADCGEEVCGEYASRSEVDNVEWLIIEHPAPGIYRIKVVPVEIYGESSTAAVAWKILRGEPEPELSLEIEEISGDTDSEYLTVDVSVDASRYLASGTTLHLGCRRGAGCEALDHAYLPHRNRVHREDGLSWSDPQYLTSKYRPIPIGEVVAGTPRRVQLAFLREKVPPGSLIHVTASSWNARSAVQSFALGMDSEAIDTDFDVPTNDSFSASERISGAMGETLLDLGLASREPGEPLVGADSRTVWFAWEAPSEGLFRIRVREADTGAPLDAEFALFTGDSLVDLELAAQKRGSEISFAAKTDTVYRLRVASGERDLPPLKLEWKPADSRPANDDFADAQVIEGERGSIDASNEGATLESSEFLDGLAATVWYEWTAPEDGWWSFTVNPSSLNVKVFAGASIGELRLRSQPSGSYPVNFLAKAGETYRIAVAARSADDSGADFTLSWRPQPVERIRFGANDLFANSIEVSGPTGSITHPFMDGVTTVDFSVEPGEPEAAGVGTAWWHWTVPEDGRYTWRMDGGSAFQVSLFTGDSLENLQLVGSLRGGSALVLEATGGSRLWIAIASTPETARMGSDSPSGLTWGPTPANDDRAAAAPILSANGSAEAMLAFATAAPGDPADTVGTDSVWWRWTAPASGWQRFWIDGHPLTAIITAYPDSVSIHAIADSERSILANGRVELHVLAHVGYSYDIRVSARAGVDKDASATLRWEASDAPAYLAYKGAVTVDSPVATTGSQVFRWPRNLTMSDDGDYVFSSSEQGVFAFSRDAESGNIKLAYKLPTAADEDTLNRNLLRRAHLWWNNRLDRLFALSRLQSNSFALPDDGSSLLLHSEIARHGGADVLGDIEFPGAGSSDGQFFYAVNRGHELLQVFRVDSESQLTHVQTVTSQGVPGDGALIVPDFGGAVDMAISPDSLHLYLTTEGALLVFSRDTVSGTLQLVREVSIDNSSEGPFRRIRRLRNASLDASGHILFVSGLKEKFASAFDAAVAAFDVSADPANPAHLDTLTEMHFETDLNTALVRNHLRPGIRNTMRQCGELVPHAERPAVDIFCVTGGFFVVAWNPGAGTLEVSDFAGAGTEDRFGNVLPYHPGWWWLEWNESRRQIALSPDGAHVYRASSESDREFADAVHIFERASAMRPD